MSSEFATSGRLFIAEFDFKKFFDSISHISIDALLREKRFLITQRETRIVRAFLGGRFLNSLTTRPHLMLFASKAFHKARQFRVLGKRSRRDNRQKIGELRRILCSLRR